MCFVSFHTNPSMTPGCLLNSSDKILTINQPINSIQFSQVKHLPFEYTATSHWLAQITSFSAFNNSSEPTSLTALPLTPSFAIRSRARLMSLRNPAVYFRSASCRCLPLTVVTSRHSFSAVTVHGIGGSISSIQLVLTTIRIAFSLR